MYECYECGVDRGGSGMREDGNCIDCGPVTKKKLKRRVEELIEAHDRLAAENAELRNEVETWKANNRRQVKAIELLRKDAERIDDLEEDFAEIQNIMGCNHDDMHHCVSTMEQELSETKADLSAANATIDKLLAIIEGAKGEYTGSCDAYNRACEIAGRKVE